MSNITPFEQAALRNAALKEAAKARLAHNARFAHLGAYPVAAPNKNAKARLDARILDWERLRADRRHDMKVQMRIDNGGFHRPGSLA